MKFSGHIPLVGTYQNRHEPESLRILADYYWRLLLIVCTMLAVAAVAYGVWELYDVDRVLTSAPSTSVTSAEHLPFDRAQLQVVVDGFARRHALYQLYSSQAPSIADPSK